MGDARGARCASSARACATTIMLGTIFERGPYREAAGALRMALGRKVQDWGELEPHSSRLAMRPTVAASSLSITDPLQKGACGASSLKALIGTSRSRTKEKDARSRVYTVDGTDGDEGHSSHCRTNEKSFVRAGQLFCSADSIACIDR